MIINLLSKKYMWSKMHVYDITTGWAKKKPDCIFDDFMFQQDGARAHRSHHTVTYLRSNVPEYIEPEN